MDVALVAATGTAVVGLGWYAAHRASVARRRRFVANYRFPSGLLDTVRAHHPQVDDGPKARMVEKALRAYFDCQLRSKWSVIGMPSRVAADLWREFTLKPEPYAKFCEEAFGKPLQLVPPMRMGRSGKQDEMLLHTWQLACAGEELDPKKTYSLPLLFRLDVALDLPGAVRHEAGVLTALAQNESRKWKRDDSADSGFGFGFDSGWGGGGDGGGDGGGE